MNIGGLINDFLDKFLPDIVGDVIGAVADGVTGNYAGAAVNALDAVEDVLELAGADRAAEFFGDVADGELGIEFATGVGTMVGGVLA